MLGKNKDKKNASSHYAEQINSSKKLQEKIEKAKSRENAKLKAAKQRQESTLFAKKFKFKPKERVEFFKAVASMLKAQINMTDCLKFYSDGLTNEGLKNKLTAIRSDVEAGHSVPKAFKNSDMFDESTLSLIQAGMLSGNLFSAFEDLAEKMETDLEFRGKIKKIVVMPCVIIPILIFGAIFSQVVILPKIEDMIMSTGFKPEGFINVFFDISHFTQKHYGKVLLIMAIIGGSIAFSSKVRDGLLLAGMKQFKIIKQLVMGIRQLNIVSVLYLMSSNGIEFTKCLKAASKSVRKTMFEEQLLQAANGLEKEGLAIGTSVNQYCVDLDTQIKHLIKIGEKSSSIADQLFMLKNMYKADARRHLDAFSNLLNFVMLAVSITLIAAVFLGTFLPVFLMGPQLMKNAG